MSSPEAALERDHLLAGAYRKTSKPDTAAARAYCARHLSGDDLNEVLNLLGLNGRDA